MKRDTLRTILAIALIVIIVAATFAYGNSQRAKQQAKTQQKEQQTQSSTSGSSSSTAKPSTPKPSTNTSSATPKATTPAQPQPAPNYRIADTGGTAARMPETGSHAEYALPLLALSAAVYGYIRSKQRLLHTSKTLM